MKFKRRIRFQNHRGVLDAGIIILGMIVAIIAIVAATLAWSDVLEVSFIKLMTEMPRFGYGVQSGHEMGNQNFEIYQILRNIAFMIMLFVLMFAGLSFMFEHINLVPPETGFTIISKSLLYVFFFFFFPPLWDLIAVTVEQTSLWILNPEDQTMPTKNVEFLLTKLGSIESPEFTLDAIVAGISDPFGTLKNMFLSVFLATFKAIAFLIFMFTAFLLGTIRIVLTAIVTIALPVTLMLSLTPFFKRVTNRFTDAMLGLMIAPIFSALVITAGVAHLKTLESTAPDPAVEWFAALAVMALATFIPAMIVPLLGSVMGSVSSITGRAVSTGAIMTNLMASGMVRTVGGVITGMTDQIRMNASTNPLSLAKLVFSESRSYPIEKTNIEKMGDGISHAGVMCGPFSGIRRMDENLFRESEQDFTLSHNADKKSKSDGANEI